MSSIINKNIFGWEVMSLLRKHFFCKIKIQNILKYRTVLLNLYRVTNLLVKLLINCLHKFPICLSLKLRPWLPPNQSASLKTNQPNYFECKTNISMQDFGAVCTIPKLTIRFCNYMLGIEIIKIRYYQYFNIFTQKFSAPTYTKLV